MSGDGNTPDPATAREREEQAEAESLGDLDAIFARRGDHYLPAGRVLPRCTRCLSWEAVRRG